MYVISDKEKPYNILKMKFAEFEEWFNNKMQTWKKVLLS